MADYVPVIEDAAQGFTSTTSAAVTGGQLLIVTGVNTVGPATAGATPWVGVAASDAASGAIVKICRDGIQTCTASGTVTAADLVAAGAAGTVATSATPTTAQLVGVALNTATTGNPVRILFVR